MKQSKSNNATSRAGLGLLCLGLAATAQGQSANATEAPTRVLRTITLDGRTVEVVGHEMKGAISHLGVAEAGRYELRTSSVDGALRTLESIDLSWPGVHSGILDVDVERHGDAGELVVAQLTGGNQSILEVFRNGAPVLRSTELTAEIDGKEVLFRDLSGVELVSDGPGTSLFLSARARGAFARSILEIDLPAQALGAGLAPEARVVGRGGIPRAAFSPDGELWIAARAVTGGFDTTYGIALHRRSGANTWSEVRTPLAGVRAVGPVDVQFGFGSIYAIGLTLAEDHVGQIRPESAVVATAWATDLREKTLRTGAIKRAPALTILDVRHAELRFLPPASARQLVGGQMEVLIRKQDTDAVKEAVSASKLVESAR